MITDGFMAVNMLVLMMITKIKIYVFRCSKIVVEANNTNQLLRVWSEVKIRKIPFFYVYDLKFNVKFISLTALAFFGSDQDLQPVTGQLKELH